MYISDLQAKQGKVDIAVDVVKKDSVREFDKEGKKGRVCNFTVKDKTGTIKLSLWNEDIDRFKVGDRVRIKNGYVSEWQGEKQLSTGKFGSVERIEGNEELEKELHELEKKDPELEKLEQIEPKTVKKIAAMYKTLDEIEAEQKELEEIDSVATNPGIDDSEHIKFSEQEKEEVLTLDELEESMTDTDADKDESAEEDDLGEEDTGEIDLVEEEVVDDELPKEKKK